MSDGEVLETLIKEGRELKAQIVRLSDLGHVQGERFMQLGRALKLGSGLPADFPWDYCDLVEARQVLTDLPELKTRLANIEDRIKRRTSLDD